MGDNAATASNLARIRDNQRRSRARRKEYLQELETKFRNCEQQGVVASAEIQAAARRVADENKRLRTLLRTKGVGENEIEAFTGARDAADENIQLSSAVRSLEKMLAERRPCHGEPFSTPLTGAEQQRTVVAPKSVPQPAQQRGSGSVPRESISPSSTSASSFANTPITPSYSLFTTTSDPASHTQAPANLFSNQQALQLPRPQQYQPLHQRHGSHQSQGSRESGLPEYNNNPAPFPPWQQRVTYASNQATSLTDTDEMVDLNDSSSCAFATDMIRSMRPDISSQEVQEHLGCTAKGCTGLQADCSVANAVVFDVMDRFTAGSRPVGQ